MKKLAELEEAVCSQRVPMGDLYTAFDFMRALQVRNTRIAVSLDEPGAYAAMEAIVGSSDGAHVLQRTAGLPQCFSFITL